MAESVIPVDIFNPGQVFACLGFLEVAEHLCGEAEGAFDWSDENDVKFRLSAGGDESPVRAVLLLLESARVYSISPKNSGLSTEKWDVPTCWLEAVEPFPYPLPGSPATLPAKLVCEKSGLEVVIDYWADGREITRRDNIKFWAGAAGYPGAALLQDGLKLARTKILEYVDNPFASSAEQSSSFRLDWRRDYIPLEIGFSVNSHSSINMVGYPLVELLGAIGLTYARPEFISKLEYRYGILGLDGASELLPLPILRASLSGASLPFPQRIFRMILDWPGKKGQARCITEVSEETNA